MISIILFVMIGIKLNMLNGWYLALLIILGIARIIEYGCKCAKINIKFSNKN